MNNQRDAKCRECGTVLFPGEGEKWLDQLPHWAKQGGYLCKGCWNIWLSWTKMKSQVEEDVLRSQLWIALNVPGEPVKAMQNGKPAVLDSRSILQERLINCIYHRTGLGAVVVAENVANFLESMEPRERSLDELTKIIFYIREVTLDRLEKAGHNIGGQTKWTENQKA